MLLRSGKVHLAVVPLELGRAPLSETELPRALAVSQPVGRPDQILQSIQELPLEQWIGD